MGALEEPGKGSGGHAEEGLRGRRVCNPQEWLSAGEATGSGAGHPGLQTWLQHPWRPDWCCWRLSSKMALCWRRYWLSAGNPQPRFPPHQPLDVGLSVSPRHGGRVPRRTVPAGPHRSVSPLRAPSGQSDGSTSAAGAGPLRHKWRRAQTPPPVQGGEISSQPSWKTPPATACQRV